MTDTATPVCPRCKGKGYRRTLGGQRRCSCTPTPAKKRSDRAATHEGECGFCERRFTVGRVDNRLALHGFQRPGSGWLIGDCPGHNRPPVEVSVETIELLRDYARQTAEAEEASSARYRSGEVRELLFRVRKIGAPVFGNADDRYEFVTIKFGDRYNSLRGIPSFDDLLAAMIRGADGRARSMRETEGRAVRRITEWKPTELRVL